MAIYTLNGTDKEISVQGRYASVKNNGTETVYASSTPDLDLNAAEVVPIQAGESVVVRDCKKKLYVRGSGQIAVVSGNEPFNFFKPAPKGGGGGSGGGITQQQLNDTLKSYATNASVDTKLEGYAEKYEIPTSLPADGGNADTVGGYTAEQLIQSNPNLLANWYFTNPVNQRGQTEYTSNNPVAMAIDGWYIGWYTVMTLEDDGIKLTATANRDYSTLRMVTSIQIPTELVGKTLHASILYSTTSIVKFGLYNRENILPTSEQKTLYECEIIPTSTQIDFVAIRSEKQNANAKVYAVKLESGNHQTLAYQDSNGDWVLNDPMPNKLESALKCGPIENESQQVLYGDGKWANVPSNLNLLDNSDFKINQRGKTEHSGYTYTADRWVKTSAGIVTIEDDGVTLNNIDGTEVMYWGQILPLNIANRPVSISFCDSNETIYSISGIAPAESKNPLKLLISDIGSFYVDLNIDHYEFFFQIKVGKSIKIKWAKLELGSVATPFIPPNPATELLKCQRYYYKLSGEVHLNIEGNFLAQTNALFGTLYLPAPMRVKPTVRLNNVYIQQNGKVCESMNSFDEYRISKDNRVIQYLLQSVDTNLLDGLATLHFNNSSIEFSADL